MRQTFETMTPLTNLHKQQLLANLNRALATGSDIQIMLIRLAHADASARIMGIPEQSRSAPLEG